MVSIQTLAAAGLTLRPRYSHDRRGPGVLPGARRDSGSVAPPDTRLLPQLLRRTVQVHGFLVDQTLHVAVHSNRRILDDGRARSGCYSAPDFFGQ